MESDGRTSRFSMIEYRYRGCCNNGVVESVRRLDFHFVDVYRIVYTDAYTDAYSVERARRLTRPGNYAIIQVDICMQQWAPKTLPDAYAVAVSEHSPCRAPADAWACCVS